MLKKHIKGYQKRFKKYGDDPRAFQCASKKAAEVRYRELVADLDFNGPRPRGPLARKGKTVLDVGCGFGDIIPFIQKKAGKFDYTGVDIVPEFIEAARKKYPKQKFVLRDYYGEPMKDSFDIILSSGTLNANIKNAIDYRERAIKTMFNHAKEVFAFNMAGGFPQPKNKKTNRVYYANLLEIYEYCLSLSSRLILRNHYRSNDFTIVIFKQNRQISP